jgi:hypothetical protein
LCRFDLVLALVLDSTVMVKSHLRHPQKIPQRWVNLETWVKEDAGGREEREPRS